MKLVNIVIGAGGSGGGAITSRGGGGGGGFVYQADAGAYGGFVQVGAPGRPCDYCGGKPGDGSTCRGCGAPT